MLATAVSLTTLLQALALRAKSSSFSFQENASLHNYTHGLTAAVIEKGSKDAEKCVPFPPPAPFLPQHHVARARAVE